MKQTKFKMSKVVFASIIAFVMAFAMILSMMPIKTLTVYAAELTSETTTWETGDYVVPEGGVTISGHITVNGTVNLTLTEGATLTANMGITLSDGATLNVSGEGAMVVKGSNGNANSTVAGTGTLVLTSGTVTVTGGNGAGVGDSSMYTDRRQYPGGNAINGTVIVNGGTLTATGGNGGGVGARSADSYGAAGGVAVSGSVTVNAGAVTATGGNGGSIGEYGAWEYGGAGGAAIGGDVTVNGGKLTATNGTHGVNGDGSGGAGGKAVSGTVTYKTALNDAITAAETLYDSIKDNTDYADIASTLQTAINNAKTVADSDEVDQDAVDTATTNITTAKTTAEADKKGVDDTKAANTVKEKITAIGTVEYTADSKTKIDEARYAYNALTDDQKVLVDTYETLTTAESTYAALKADNDAADEVKAKIAAIGEVEYTTGSEELIEEARIAYEALTPDQKALVTNYETLTTAEAEYKTLDDNAKADEVKAKIAAIGKVEYTTESKTKIDTARNAYNALTDEQKALVDTYETLTTAESNYATLKADNDAADAVKTVIAEIGIVENTTESKTKIDEARNAYNALTDDQKALVTNYGTLTTAEAEYKTLDDNAKADAVKTIIAEIGTVENTADSKAKIDTARNAYNALTDDQKALVTTYSTLTTAENRYADLVATDNVKAKIDVIGTVEYTADSKAKIEQARNAYNALTAEQKAIISAETLATLTTAETIMTNMETAHAVEVSIADINADKANKGQVKEVREAYNALTDEQKAYVTNYENLENAEKTISKKAATTTIIIIVIVSVLVVGCAAVVVLNTTGVVNIPFVTKITSKIFKKQK